MKDTQANNEYDLEPVSYCPKCYSLKIGYIPGVDDSDYCMNCGCIDVVRGNIFEWEKLYETRYGHKYVVPRKSYEGHPLWNLSVKDLRKTVLESSYWQEIIQEVYPDWKHYGNIVDTVYLFFDKVIGDRLLPRLKKILINRQRDKKL